MDALRQYIELYDAHSRVVNAGGADPLNRLRPEAADSLRGITLPPKGSENYENIDLAALLAPDYGLNLQRVPMDVNTEATFRCDIPVSKPKVMTIVNDTFMEQPDVYDALPEGVEAGSLRKFALDYPEIVGKWYGRAASLSNPVAALNTLFAQDGLWLRVKRGVKLEKPLQLVAILASQMPLMAVRRLLVVMEEDSEAKLLVCDHSQEGAAQGLVLEVSEVFLGRGAHFELCHVEESTPATSRLSALFLRQQEGSEANLNAMTLYNGTTRNEIDARFEGEHASLKLSGMGIEDGNRVLSTYTRIDHAVPHCKSNELYKYSVDGNATGAFTGRIHVAEGAVGTEAYQANRNLVASDDARMFSKPQLEIYNDDVKCSHGCAIGQLDPMQVFYMRTRGLSEETARLLLRQAFMADVIANVDIPWLRDRLHLLTEKRFAGQQTACANCDCHGHLQGEG